MAASALDRLNIWKVKDDSGHEHADDGKFTSGGGGGKRPDKPKGKKPETKPESSISEDDKKTIEDYKRTGYAKINAHLRRGDKAHMSPAERQKAQEGISKLEKIIDKSPLPQDTRVYRGIGDPEFFKNFDQLMGAVITDAGFISTSQSVDIAAQHARSANMGIREKKKPAKGIIAVIKLPKGTKAVSLGPDDSEKEIIVQRSSQFKVVSTDKSGPYWRVDLEAIA